jgi:hypothetical protein
VAGISLWLAAGWLSRGARILNRQLSRSLAADVILADDDPGPLRLDGNLGIGLASRYSVTGSPQDRDRAIAFLGWMLGCPGADDDFDDARRDQSYAH